MLTILLTALLFAVSGYFFSKQIRVSAIFWYIVASLIAIFVDPHSANIFSLGYVAFGILLLVMFMGVFDKGKFRNQLLGVRGEYAIIGTILLFPHAWGYFEFYGLENNFFQNNLSFYIGIIALITMLPLTLTSFRIVKSKMKYKKWKKLHQLSYLFYALIATHIILLDNQRFWLYVMIFGVYTIMKVIMLLQPNKAKQQQKHKAIQHN